MERIVTHLAQHFRVLEIGHHPLKGFIVLNIVKFV
jgi:hypothetical protein